MVNRLKIVSGSKNPALYPLEIVAGTAGGVVALSDYYSCWEMCYRLL
jgi:hypothetical protein